MRINVDVFSITSEWRTVRYVQIKYAPYYANLIIFARSPPWVWRDGPPRARVYMYAFILLGIGLERVRARTYSELTAAYVRKTCATYCTRTCLTYYYYTIDFFRRIRRVNTRYTYIYSYTVLLNVVTAYTGVHVFRANVQAEGKWRSSNSTNVYVYREKCTISQ